MYLRLLIPLGFGGVGSRLSLLSDLESLVGDSSMALLSRSSLRGPSPDTSDENSGPNLRNFGTNLDGDFQAWNANVITFINDT